MPRCLRLAARTLVACLALGAAGCLSPTLPLPPPEPPGSIRALGAGQFEIRGECSPGALVIALVERTGQGVALEDRDADGRYRIVVEASACDVLLLSQVDGEERSGGTRVVLTETEGGSPVDPSACAR